jgi:hypothetical protein
MLQANKCGRCSKRARPARGAFGVLLAGFALAPLILSELTDNRPTRFLDYYFHPAPPRHHQLAGISDSLPSVPYPDERVFDPRIYMDDVSNNFDGVWARPYKPWWFAANGTAMTADRNRAHPIPCMPPELKWSSDQVQSTPTTTGLLFLKPYKTASSTGAGIHLRIARNAARRRNHEFHTNKSIALSQAWPICQVRMSHGPSYQPAHSLGYGK